MLRCRNRTSTDTEKTTSCSSRSSSVRSTPFRERKTASDSREAALQEAWQQLRCTSVHTRRARVSGNGMGYRSFLP